MQARGLTKNIGGLRAVDSVDLSVRRGAVVAIIGPNGAGKTTLLNCLSGFMPPSSGQVYLAGQPVTGLSPSALCHAGMARTFQVPKPFPELTVLQTVQVALDQRRDMNADVTADDILDRVAYHGPRDMLGANLSVINRKRLELARALATGPAVILLDEVCAGLSPSEVDELIDILRAINESGITLVMVEHVLSAVLALAEQVLVLDRGRTLASGRPQEVMKNEAVVAAYLGSSVEDAAIRTEAPSGRTATAHSVGNAVKPGLKVESLSSGYGDLQVVHDVSLEVNQGEVIALLGVNGAGKSTLLRAISGLLPSTGWVKLDEQDLTSLGPHQRVAAGLVHVPEARQLFPNLTVDENLMVGSTTPAGRPKRAEHLSQVRELFPVLAERRGQRAGTMSGGEQQMLAIARALMSGPRVLMLDEPSLGVAPVVIDVLMNALRSIADGGIPVLLVEQNAVQALRIADRVYVLDDGRIVASGPGAEFLEQGRLAQVYLGVETAAEQRLEGNIHG